MTRRFAARPFWVMSLAALGSFAVTWPRIARDVVLFGDSAELVAAAKLWGVPHPTGYPLWTLLAHFASRASVGNVAFHVHLTSSVFHALAVGISALLALRLGGSLVASVATALCLTLAKSFLLGSTYAEVFPLNDLFFALLLLVAVVVREVPAPRQLKWLAALAALLGLSLGHHQMTALGVPALGLVIWPSLRRVLGERPVRALWLALAFLAPLVLSTALLLLAARRHSVVSYGDIHDLPSLLRVLLRSDYGGLLSASRHPSRMPAGERIGVFTLLSVGSLGPLALAAALVGSLVLLHTRRALALALLVAWLVTGPMFAALNKVGVDGEAQLAFFERFTTMAHIPVALLAGVGSAWLAEQLPRVVPARRLLALAVGAMPGLALIAPASSVDPSHDRAGLALVRDLFRDVPDGSLVLISGDLYTSATQYLCATEGACERLIIAAPGQLFLPWKVAELRRRYPGLGLPEGPLNLARSHEIVAREIGRRPVFVVPSVISRDPELAQSFEFLPLRLLVRVLPDEKTVDAERERFVALARALESGEGCAGCRLDARTIQRPSQHVEVLEAYSAMFVNHARRAARFGARDQALALDRRARALDELTRPRAVLGK